MNSSSGNKTALYWIGLIIGLFFMFGFGYICPTWSTVTPIGVKGIGVFIGAILMVTIGTWGLILPALLALLALLVTGVFDAGTLTAGTFGNAIVVQIIFIYVLCQAAVETGTGEVIAKWMISRKFCQGKPLLWTIIFFAAAYVIGALLELGGLLICYTILESVAKELGYDEKSRWTKFMTLGVFLCMTTGYTTLPFKSIPLIIYGNFVGMLESYEVTLSMGLFIVFALILSIIILLGYILMMKYLFKVDMSKIANFDIRKMEGYSNLKLTRSQLAVCLVFLLAVLFPIVQPFVNPESSFGMMLNNIGMAFWFVLCILIIGIMRVDGKQMIDLNSCFRNGVMWQVVLQLCAFLMIGNVLSGPAGGIKDWILTILMPVFDNLPFWAFILILALVSIIITNVLSNITTGVILASLTCPLIVAYAQSLGTSITIMVACVIYGSNVAFLTMTAGAAGPLLHTKTCYEGDRKFILKYGVVILAFVIVVLWLFSLLFSQIF